MSSPDMMKATEVPWHKNEQPIWLMSFADFTGCLLASFVLLFALSQTDQARMRAKIVETPEASIGQEFGGAEESMAAQPTEDGKDIDYLRSLLETKLGADPVLAKIPIAAEDGHIRLDLPASLITASNESDREQGKKMLHALAGVLSVLSNDSVLQAEVPAPRGGEAKEFWAAAMQLADRLVGILRDSGAPESLLARATLSRDGGTHIRVLVLRDAEIR